MNAFMTSEEERAIMLREEAEDDKWIREKFPLERLMWYLNAGGRRRWVVVEKPDEVLRNEKSPDYVLQEERTNAMLTVEITCIPFNLDQIRSERLHAKFYINAIVNGKEIEALLREYPSELKKLRNKASMADLEFFASKIEEAYQEACEKFKNYKKGESVLLFVIDTIIDEQVEFLIVNPDINEYDKIVEECIHSMLIKYPELRGIEPEYLDEVLFSPYFDYESEIFNAIVCATNINRGKFKFKSDINRVYVYEAPTRTIRRLI